MFVSGLLGPLRAMALPVNVGHAAANIETIKLWVPITHVGDFLGVGRRSRFGSPNRTERYALSRFRRAECRTIRVSESTATPRHSQRRRKRIDKQYRQDRVPRYHSCRNARP
jgi:hypothetical protein